ncbi:amino acid ABC transporter permease [Pseudarthrobacter sp. fls2-241-R2A-168]|uniref:amino acid ABC transporter permease n=1 Tax=Pseudarthrobacter sp. fls2-241-R2A-168 TaxID=3040304 RepID=UPI0025574332|nr:amino acid ABC transporter permease [Pseudarthrobacter sp. fls2-241-R2A-168]
MTTKTEHIPPPSSLDDVGAAKKRFRPVRLATTVIVLLIAVQLLVFMTTNEKFEWNVVAEYLFYPTVLMGVGVTLLLTFVGMVLGSVLGTFIAAGQLSGSRTARWFCKVFVGVFRGVPPLVQLIFWFNLAYLVPRIELGLPFASPFFSLPTNQVMTPLMAAVIGLTLHEAAYMSEIIRAGIISVDRGQLDAAKAMGFTSGQAFRKVTLPQAMRVIIPPTGSQVIGLLKGTSLVSVIGMTDLLLSTQLIYNLNYKIVPLIIVSVVWYLAVVSVLTAVQRKVEDKFGQGHALTSPTRAAQKLQQAKVLEQ